MLRLVSILLAAIVFITIARNIIVFALRFLASFAQMPASRTGKPAPPDSNVPLTGELKKDPVCGTYTSAATSLRQTVGSQTFYFCSAQCRDKFAARA